LDYSVGVGDSDLDSHRRFTGFVQLLESLLVVFEVDVGLDLLLVDPPAVLELGHLPLGGL
jgi:hypothetical protein